MIFIIIALVALVAVGFVVFKMQTPPKEEEEEIEWNLNGTTSPFSRLFGTGAPVDDKPLARFWVSAIKAIPQKGGSDPQIIWQGSSATATGNISFQKTEDSLNQMMVNVGKILGNATINPGAYQKLEVHYDVSRDDNPLQDSYSFTVVCKFVIEDGQPTKLSIPKLKPSSLVGGKINFSVCHSNKTDTTATTTDTTATTTDTTATTTG